MEKDEILSLLKKYKINLKLWGIGLAQSLDKLVEEVVSGESILIEKDNVLIRKVLVVSINVFYRDGVDVYKLIEEKQVFKDGRVRNRNLSTSMGEKLRPEEDKYSAVYRALSEELGIGGNVPDWIEDVSVIERVQEKKGPLPSISFPGLKTIYEFFVFEVWLPEEYYKSEGYIEHQSDKDTHFIWLKQSSV